MLDHVSFKARVDATMLAELSGDGTTPDDVKLQHALDDAWNEIAGYTFRLSADATPPDVVLEAHQYNITMYRLAGNRAGTEFKSIAERYKASVRWLESLKKDDDNDLGVLADAEGDDPLFDQESLAEFGNLEADS